MAVQAALFSIRRRDEENDDDDMDDLEHASDNEDEIYTLGLAQRRAEAADRATKLGGDCTEGGAPWAVLLSKFLAAEGVIQRQKEDGKRAYGHERGEAEAVLAAIHRVTTSAESNKQNYLSLLTYIVSLLLFLVVVMMQRVPQEMFQVEEAVRSALLADEGGLVESFSGEAATEIDAMTDVRVCVSATFAHEVALSQLSFSPPPTSSRSTPSSKALSLTLRGVIRCAGMAFAKDPLSRKVSDDLAAPWIVESTQST
jgi:hypothetical protein